LPTIAFVSMPIRRPLRSPPTTAPSFTWAAISRLRAGVFQVRQTDGALQKIKEDEIMSRKVKGEPLPPFVPLLKETLASPAWRAMSHGARSLYVCLKSRYNSKQFNNGRLHVSQRQAAKEIGSAFAQVARWFRELQHYGFIVMVKAGHLGLDGKGKAPHWRLTECSYMHDPPTRDFHKWNRKRFIDEKRRRKKQNPVAEIRNIQAKPALRKTATFLVNHLGRATVGGLRAQV
jgi:hypothetical protein